MRWDRQIFGCVAGFLVASVMVSAVQAQYASVSGVYRVVEAGRLIKIVAVSALDPDCRSRGPTMVNLIEAPAMGQVGVKYGVDYTTYPVGNPRSACNRRRVSATLVSYRANPDATGQDSFVVEVISPDGVARRARYFVNVR